jgi:hypothetical protein
LAIEVRSLEVRAAEDIDSAFEVARNERPDALLTVEDPLTFSYQQRIAGFAVANQLPSLHGVKEFALAGGLMSYGTNVADVYRRAASYVDKILKGASPTTARHIFSSSILQENAPWRQSADRLQFFSPTWWACLGAPPPAPLWRSHSSFPRLRNLLPPCKLWSINHDWGE